MSIIAKIPDDSRPRYPVIEFISDNLDVNGQYDFGNVGNTNVAFMPLQKGHVYLIERINFSANVAEAVWLESQIALADYPAFRLDLLLSKSKSIYPEPVRCVNFVDNAEQLIYFRSQQEDDIMRITFNGKVKQIAETAGELNLTAAVSMTIYQIVDGNWIKAFEASHKGGSSLLGMR